MVFKKKSKSLGTLEVRPCKGRDLRVVQKIGKQDPFLQFELGNGRQRTKADKNGGQKPTWNERLTFEIVEGVHKVVVKCFDQNLREHAFIGEGEIDFSTAITYYQLDNWFQLKDKGEPAGEVYLEFTFFPVDGQKNPPPLPFTPSPIVSNGTPMIPLKTPATASPTVNLSIPKAQPSPKTRNSPKIVPKAAAPPTNSPKHNASERNGTQAPSANTNKGDHDGVGSYNGVGPAGKHLPILPPSSRSNTPSQNGSPQSSRHGLDNSDHAEQGNLSSHFSQVPSYYQQYPYPISPEQGMYLPGPYYPPPDPYAYGYPMIPGTPFPPVCPDPAAYGGYPMHEGYMSPFPDMHLHDPGMYPDRYPMPEEFAPPIGMYYDEYGVPLPMPPMNFMPYPAMVPPGRYVHPDEEKQK
ncbi:hypothetical protein K7432_000090 [Basidiobolus ranarum]|uniref:C2 domain-containing protein n=1 Tax=Basidiobolus ranarum TaxID=34480 RepID=A0ABR2WBT4_9FUNG